MTILTLEMLRELVNYPSFKIRITEDEISDRSKGDRLAKLMFIVQTSWFITQCIARYVHHTRNGEFEWNYVPPVVAETSWRACNYACVPYPPADRYRAKCGVSIFFASFRFYPT